MNRENVAGIVIAEAMKLAKTNWVVMAFFPPARSARMGTPLIGGTAACRKKRMAML